MGRKSTVEKGGDDLLHSGMTYFKLDSGDLAIYIDNVRVGTVISIPFKDQPNQVGYAFVLSGDTREDHKECYTTPQLAMDSAWKYC